MPDDRRHQEMKPFIKSEGIYRTLTWNYVRVFKENRRYWMHAVNYDLSTNSAGRPQSTACLLTQSDWIWLAGEKVADLKPGWDKI